MEISANALGSQNLNNGMPGAPSFQVDASGQQVSYVRFTLTMSTTAFGTAGFVLAAGPSFVKGTYTLPTGATFALQDTASANTSLYNPTGSDAGAYAAVLELMSQVPTVIQRIEFDASTQSDITGNSFVAMYQNPGTVSATQIKRFALNRYFIPGNYNTGSAATVMVENMNLVLNNRAWLQLQNGISVSNSGTFQIDYRAAGGGTANVQVIGG